MMEINVNSQTALKGSSEEQYPNAIYRLFVIVHERISKPWYFFNKIFRHSKLYEEHQTHIQLLHKLTDQVIEEKLPAFKNKKLNHQDDKFKKTFLDEIFRQLDIPNSGWSEDNVRDEITTMFSAGTDTTAHTLSKIFKSFQILISF